MYTDAFFKGGGKQPKKVLLTKNQILILVFMIIILIVLGVIFYLQLKEEKDFLPKITIKVSHDKNEWTNEDIDLTIYVASSYAIKNLEYALNCQNNCTYTPVVNHHITINESNDNYIVVRAIDANGNVGTNSINVLVDKENPEITLIPNNTEFIGTNSVTVCGSCVDNLSGCVDETVCKTYTESTTDFLKGVDNAGNEGISSTFKVTINKE